MSPLAFTNVIYGHFEYGKVGIEIGLSVSNRFPSRNRKRKISIRNKPKSDFDLSTIYLLSIYFSYVILYFTHIKPYVSYCICIISYAAYSMSHTLLCQMILTISRNITLKSSFFDQRSSTTIIYSKLNR